MSPHVLALMAVGQRGNSFIFFKQGDWLVSERTLQLRLVQPGSYQGNLSGVEELVCNTPILLQMRLNSKVIWINQV